MPNTKKVRNSRPKNWLPKKAKDIEKFLKKFKKDYIEDSKKYKKLYELITKYHPIIKKGQAGTKEELRPYVTKKEIEELDLHEPVRELYVLIITDPEVNMFFNQMFWNQNPEYEKLCDSWQDFIVQLDAIMTYTPVYSRDALVGFPINALVNWPMATADGYACFLNDKVNAILKRVLNYWAQFLMSPASRSVLHSGEEGWFCEDALKDMEDDFGNSFTDQFQCNSDEEHYGFKSWDDFFTRQFRPGVRPLPSPDADNIIANACESAPYKIETGVNPKSVFWMKEQPYSLDHMLSHNGWAEYFHGGTIYQAFLSALSYHRWHSPISGTIIETEIIDGSYYSQTHVIQDDYASPNMSQGYITHVAARAVIYIMADNPLIGVLGFVSIGMSEVSSNDITVKKGQHVEKGEQLGMFHFGGSTHCLLFRPGVSVQWEECCQNPSLDADNIPLHQKIGTVMKATQPK
ncbi:uncharacterized protein [Clytia hemisphaerica]|uniref:L-tryptophan decarboxylase PsiD-like domain-containing protein n=1 Tax=Clytia hemisphaerica TaxID=252671 RepID=A0A7M5WVN9_9CNID|eukprot:TCONS_00070944-protein